MWAEEETETGELIEGTEVEDTKLAALRVCAACVACVACVAAAEP